MRSIYVARVDGITVSADDEAERITVGVRGFECELDRSATRTLIVKLQTALAHAEGRRQTRRESHAGNR